MYYIIIIIKCLGLPSKLEAHRHILLKLKWVVVVYPTVLTGVLNSL